MRCERRWGQKPFAPGRWMELVVFRFQRRSKAGVMAYWLTNTKNECILVVICGILFCRVDVSVYVCVCDYGCCCVCVRENEWECEWVCLHTINERNVDGVDKVLLLYARRRALRALLALSCIWHRLSVWLFITLPRSSSFGRFETIPFEFSNRCDGVCARVCVCERGKKETDMRLISSANDGVSVSYGRSVCVCMCIGYGCMWYYVVPAEMNVSISLYAMYATYSA